MDNHDHFSCVVTATASKTSPGRKEKEKKGRRTERRTRLAFLKRRKWTEGVKDSVTEGVEDSVTEGVEDSVTATTLRIRGRKRRKKCVFVFG